MTTYSIGNDPETHAAQQNKRMNVDWFRSPVTSYLDIASISYPRGSRATIAELDENNALVDVLFYRNADRTFLRNARQPGEWVVQLLVESEDFQDATADSVPKFASLGIQSKSLIDAIKSALSSVNYPLPDNVNQCVNFYPPFHDLFFAQGRILETLKHAGLGNVKERQLRAFVTVLQVVLRKLNRTIRDLSSKKVVDFENLWTLFPPGSFAVTTVKDLPHIVQVLTNSGQTLLSDPRSDRKGECYLPIKFSSWGYDGYNFGSYNDSIDFHEFKGYSNISTLDYRPLRYEERYEDSSIVKKAIERGRKSLDLQDFHHCQYSGKCHAVKSDLEPPERNINGRIVVDALQARNTSASHLGFFCHSELPIMPIPSKRQEIYNAMRPLFLSSLNRRPTKEEQEKRKAFFSNHEEYLMLTKPILPIWSLEHNDWYWGDIANVEPIDFPEAPMDRIVDSASRQFGLLNILIDRKLEQQVYDQEVGKGKGGPLIISFSGPAGTGKTTTVQAIADLHQRPLVTLGTPAAGLNTGSIVVQFFQTLENAVAWRAIVLFDNAETIFGLHKREVIYDQTHIGMELAQYMRHFNGVAFLTKKDDQRFVYDILKEIQAHIDFVPFDAKKREKIWRKMLQESRNQLDLSNDLIRDISEWDLDGRDMKHLLTNINLILSDDDMQNTNIRTIEEIRDLTFVPKQEWTGWRSNRPCCEPAAETTISVRQ